MTRVIQRDWALWSHQQNNDLWAKDGHVRLTLSVILYNCLEGQYIYIYYIMF